MKVSKGTIIRTIMLVLVIINIILKSFGIKPLMVSESDITQGIEAVFEIAVIAVTFWKNNSFSQAAIRADKLLKEIKENETKK